MPTTATRRQVRIAVGELGCAEMPWSEVCMHMGVAGKRMDFALVGERAVQLLHPDGFFFSFPILPGEAGIYEDADGHYYYDNE